MPWLQHLTRLESLINIGCKFGPNDLPPDVWDGLIAMALERQFVDALVDQRRAKRDKSEKELRQARDAMGTPGPGSTIFPQKTPFK